MPNPITKICPDPHVILDNNVLDDKPDMAILVTAIFAASARVDHSLKFLFTEIFGAESEPAMAMYSMLQTQQLQMKALDVTAKAAIPEDYDIFKAAMSVATSSQSPRHYLAHWIWAKCKQRPDLLVLGNPNMLQERDMRVTKILKSLKSAEEIDSAHLAEQNLFDDSQFLAFTKKDLERALKDLVDADALLLYLFTYLNPMRGQHIQVTFGLNLSDKDQIRAESLEKLNDQPLFRAALTQIRMAQNNTPPTHRGSPPLKAGE